MLIGTPIVKNFEKEKLKFSKPVQKWKNLPIHKIDTNSFCNLRSRIYLRYYLTVFFIDMHMQHENRIKLMYAIHYKKGLLVLRN